MDCIEWSESRRVNFYSFITFYNMYNHGTEWSDSRGGGNCVMLSSHATLYETILMILSGQTVGGLTVLWLHL